MSDSLQTVNCKFSFAGNQKKVIWELTNTCNYACDYCIFASNGRENPHELSLEKIKSTLKELKEQGFDYIKFTGGEPFLRLDILDIFKTCKELRINYDVSTNASLLSDALLQELVKLQHLSFLHISLDGFDKASHEAVRGAKTWERTLKGLNLASMYPLKKRVGCVLHTENYLCIPDIVNFLISKNIDVVAFSLMQPAGRMALNDKRLLTSSQVAAAVDAIEKEKTKNPKIQIVSNLLSQEYKTNQCLAGESFLFIDSIGTVSPCPWVSDKDRSYLTQSLKEKGLIDILKGPMFTSFKLKAKYSPICPAQAQVSNLIESKFHKFYVFSNENLNHLPLLDEGSVVATTGSSIDQAFSFLLKGASRVEIVDINPKTKFYMELKISALTIFSQREFISFFTADMSYSQYKKLRDALSASSQKYWDTEYLLNNYKSLLETEIFVKGSHSLNKDAIPYLREENYELLRTLDLAGRLHFNNVDLMKERTTFKKFDLLYLSNIPDYSHKYFGPDHTRELFNCFKGHLALHEKIIFYVYDATNINGSDKRNILNSEQIRQSMANEISCKLEEQYFNSIFNTDQKDALCTIMKKV